MLLVLFASALASAQSSDTTASETWKSAAASAAAASSTSAGPTNLVPTPPDDVEAAVPDTAEISPTSNDAIGRCARFAGSRGFAAAKSEQ